MAISKVVYGNDTLIDITDSTVDSSNMLNGTVGYSSAGERTVGTYVDSDEKVKQDLVDDNSWHTMVFSKSNTINQEIDSLEKSKGLLYINNPIGTTSAAGIAHLAIGNSTKTGNANNYKGKLRLYDSNDKRIDLYTNTLTGDHNILLPDANGTIALTSDIPTPPTVNNSTITIQKNGTDVDSFTTNASSAKSINITMAKGDVGLGNVPNVSTNNQTPTFSQASSRANIASGEKLSVIFGKIMKWFADLKDLAFIAKDGDSSTKYLRGDGQWIAFPTIPTVNNATLTIQKNGTTVKTFTANASSNVTCNITVPTALSDLTDDATHRIVTDTEKSTWNAKGSSNLTLGETSSTAYRGDRGKSAYTHASDSGKTTTATTSGLYKIACTNQGHVASLTAVVKADITGLGIPAQDTTYEVKSAARDGTAESLVTTGEKYTWNNKLNLSGGTLTGNFILKRTSQKTASADPDTPAQLQLQTVWNDASTTPVGDTKTANSYLRAYSDRGGGNNVVLTTGANLFIGSGEAPPNHYSEWRNTEGRTLTTEHTFLTSDNQIYLQAGANTIANRTGFRMDVAGNEPRIIPCTADSITNNIGMIGHSSYKWKHGYFNNINGNSVPSGSSTFVLKSDLEWKGEKNVLKPNDPVQSPDDYILCSKNANEIKIVCNMLVSSTTGYITLPLIVSVGDITATASSGATAQRFRTGYYQSGANGGELSIFLWKNDNNIEGQAEYVLLNGNTPASYTLKSSYR